MNRTAFSRFAAVLMLLALTVSLFGCSSTAQPAESDKPASQNADAPANTPAETPAQTPAAEEPKRATLIAVGDNLLHNTVSMDCKTADGGFDFTHLYASVAPYASAADIAFVNQEVPLGGTELGIGKYPSLNAPQEAGRALAAAGFNLVNEATNHALDKRQQGLMNTLALWKELQIPVIGAFSTEEESKQPCLIEKNGIKFGFVGYTYGTNGIPLPADKPWCVSLIDEAKIRADLAALRPQCDYLVVSMHWGTEYQLKENAVQDGLARLLADCGADLIIGHHPHVIQPAAWLDRADGGKTFCVYSLGNFISGQQKKNTMLGGMLGLTVVKAADGTVTTENPGLLPLMTHYENGAKHFGVFPLEDYTAGQMALHAIKKYDSPISLEGYQALAQQVFGEFLKTKETFACRP